MRILVCVKWVLDTDGTIPVDTEANAILQAGLHWTVSPLDRLALEEAARMKEAGICRAHHGALPGAGRGGRCPARCPGFRR